MTVHYTPGPWHWHRSRTKRHLQNKTGSCFAQVSMPIDRIYDADARLIAAAPDMLAALYAARNVLDADTDAYKQVTAAIANAIGAA